MHLAFAHAGAFGNAVLDEFMMNNLKTQTLGESCGYVLTQRRYLPRHCD
jgi:hypothetical protein